MPDNLAIAASTAHHVAMAHKLTMPEKPYRYDSVTGAACMVINFDDAGRSTLAVYENDPKKIVCVLAPTSRFKVAK